MKYQEKIQIDEKLNNIVLCYWELKLKIEENKKLNSRYIPKPQNLLFFNLGDDFKIDNEHLLTEILPNIFVVHYSTISNFVSQAGQVNLFGITFVSNGLYKLFGQPVRSLTSIDTNLVGRFQYAAKVLKSINEFDEKAMFIEKFLTDNIKSDVKENYLENAIQLIDESKGAISVQQVVKKLNITTRYLQKLFNTQLGISPKDYCKIVRFGGYLDYILMHEVKVDWMDLVVAFNYHDQPHLIREVKSITKLSPEEIIKHRDSLYHNYYL